MNYCEDCGQSEDDGVELRTCSECEQIFCADCISVHEDECDGE